MKRMDTALGGSLAALGWPGIVGLGLAVFACAFYFSTLQPEQARLDELRRQSADAHARGAAGDGYAASTSPRDRLNAFYGYFPGPDELPDLLAKVFAAAKTQGLELRHGEYRVVGDKAGGLTQFQISLPTRGTYPQIRAFVGRTLADVPTLSLDGIQFERQKVGEMTVDAKIKMVVFLGTKS
jgi:hypothetical protein